MTIDENCPLNDSLVDKLDDLRIVNSSGSTSADSAARPARGVACSWLTLPGAPVCPAARIGEVFTNNSISYDDSADIGNDVYSQLLTGFRKA